MLTQNQGCEGLPHIRWPGALQACPGVVQSEIDPGRLAVRVAGQSILLDLDLQVAQKYKVCGDFESCFPIG